jgi:hypothetical protein
VELPPDVIADQCAFCESPLVDGSGWAEPADRVAAFLVPQEAAADRLGDYLSGRWFAPESVRTAGEPDRLRGVLVPFWSYEAVARSQYTARIGIWWYRTEVYTETITVDGETKTVTRTRQVRETEWFHTSGSHVATYTDHLVSGSRGLAEEESNQLEPFDLGMARPFAPELLAGWTAERATIDHDEARRVAADELTARENDAIRRFLPGDEVRGVENDTSVEVQSAELILLPVWIATYRHKGEVVRLLVNGQTGEVVGRTPRSAVKIVTAILVGLGMLMAVLFIGLMLGARL